MIYLWKEEHKCKKISPKPTSYLIPFKSNDDFSDQPPDWPFPKMRRHQKKYAEMFVTKVCFLFHSCGRFWSITLSILH